jgi:hypothetical protein
MEMQHIINLVDHFNREYYIKTKDDELSPFSFHSNGSEWIISFLEKEMFSTIDDSSEEIDTIEELKSFIKLRCLNFIATYDYLYDNESV